MELRTHLNEELTERFMVVKEHTCMKTDSNVLRFLISQAYDKVQETRFRRLFVAPETCDKAEKEAAARRETVDIYVQELIDDEIKREGK